MTKVSVIVISHNRKHYLEHCINSLINQKSCIDELLVIDNNSTDGTDTLFDQLSRYDFIRFIKLNENKGVSGGRNYGIKKATGDILIFIDDDAELITDNAINMIVDRFQDDANIGVLAFKILNHHTKTIQREEFPHINKSLNSNIEFETSYFIGAGHAIKKEVFEKCGLYPENYFYSMEELDLSFRVIDKGYKILYYPHVEVLHKRSMKGRMPDNNKWIFTYRNRLAISYKYLNVSHFISVLIIWFLKVAKESAGISTPIKGIMEFIKYKRQCVRDPISDESILKIKKLKGRIWY